MNISCKFLWENVTFFLLTILKKNCVINGYPPLVRDAKGKFVADF